MKPKPRFEDAPRTVKLGISQVQQPELKPTPLFVVTCHFKICSPWRRSMEGMNSTDSAQDSPTPAHERTAASERPKKTYSLSNALVIAAFVAWVSKTIWGFRAILDPMRNITLVPGEPTLQNLWKQGTPVRFCALPHECIL
jgi:hypothetical protein